MNLERIMVNLHWMRRVHSCCLGRYAPGGKIVEHHQGDALWTLVRILGGGPR